MFRSYLFLPIYLFLKWLVWFTLRIYFKKISVYNSKNLSIKGPLIIVSNHPNTLIDPINIAAHSSRILHFLANAGLFKNIILGGILKLLYSIPVERPQDTNGKPIDNKKAFKFCDELLDRNGCLYIAPEGTSFLEKRIRPLKTGTVRIAYEAESGNNFQLGLRILPVGIHYLKAEDAHSELIITAGEPMELSEYKSDFENDYFGTVKKITSILEKKLKELIVDVDNVELEKKYDALYALAEHHEQGRSGKDILALRQHFVQKYSPNNSDNLPLLDEAFQLEEEAKKQRFLLQSIQDNPPHGLVTLLLAPFALLSFVINWFVFLFPTVMIRLIKPVIEYRSTFKYLGGVVGFFISFPFHYHYIYKHVFSLGLSEYWDKTMWVTLHAIGIKLVLIWKDAYKRRRAKKSFQHYIFTEKGKDFLRRVERVTNGLV